MAVNTTTIQLGEMRPGLFRIHWTFGDINKEVYKQEFQLCGTQSGRKFNITYHIKSLGRNEDNRQEYTVTLDEISRNGDSSDFEADAVNLTSHQAQPKRPKLDLKLLEPEILHPVYIWVHVGPNSDGINPVKLTEKNPVQWEADCVGKLQLCFTLWIDFGMNTVTEKKIAAGLSALFQKQTLCDVQFHLKDGQSIGAHVAILSAGSPVFAAIFQSDFSASKIREVFAGNVEPEVFIQLLTCLYTGSAPKLTEMALPLLDVADLYDVETLKDDCIYVLEKQLSTENAIEMLIWSHVHVIPKLFEPVMKFVLENCRKLFSLPEWMELVKNHPELCVQANQRMADLLQQSEN